MTSDSLVEIRAPNSAPERRHGVVRPDAHRSASPCCPDAAASFYLGRGYELLAEPFPELFELEPEYAHMKKTL